MMINRSGAGALAPPVEPRHVRIRDGKPVAGLLAHTDEGDIALDITDLAAADELVWVANALRAELAVAIEANRRVTGSGGSQ
ncbi:MAG TPA: hypothetical protein VFF37_06665 [Streptomyces sp.]|nr:hypothetical protein [Streptomyces sp.]